MLIVFDNVPPRAPRRSASVPTSASLLNRIQKPPLAERLSRDDSTIKAPSGPYVHYFIFSDFRLPFFSLSDVLLLDRSVTDLLVVVEVVVPTLTPTLRVHPKVLKKSRLPQSSIKNWMHLWEMLMSFLRAMLLLLLLEKLIWLERSFSFFSPSIFILFFGTDYMFTVKNSFFVENQMWESDIQESELILAL